MLHMDRVTGTHVGCNPAQLHSQLNRAKMSGELNRLRSCFQPSQWFKCESEPDLSVISQEDTFMWVYRKEADGTYQVGYFTPDGKWFAESTHEHSYQASARVNYLNGGR